MASTLLNGPSIEVAETNLKGIMAALDEHHEAAMLYRFDEMRGATLAAHVRGASQTGPWIEGSLVYCTRSVLEHFSLANQEAARQFFSKWWGGETFSGIAGGHFNLTPNRPAHEWNSHIRDLLTGSTAPSNFPGLVPGSEKKLQPWSVAIQPVIIVSDDKNTRWWGMIRQGWPAPAAQQSEWALQNFQLVRNTPSPMTVMSSVTGDILYQNNASMSLYGNRSLLFSNLSYQPVADILADRQGSLVSSPMTRSDNQPAADRQVPLSPLIRSRDSVSLSKLLQVYAPSDARSSCDLFSHRDDGESTGEEGLNFLQLLLLGCKADEREQYEEITKRKSFSVRAEIVSERLKTWMNLPSETQCYHDITINISFEPNTLHKTYIIIQSDVTESKLASRAIRQANAELAEERERIHALLRRQYELIDIMRSETFATSQADDNFTQKINFLRGAIAKDAEGSDILAQAEEISLGKILGRGNFGAVYLGEWRGTTVAVKRMVLPAAMTNSERAHQMAVMEVGISSSMAHPHLVRTYTYSIRPIQDENSGGSQSTVTGHELRLVMEYCDRGSLGGLLKDYGGFKDDEGLLDYAAVLETASDIAKGMMHLHKNNICHNDLKANNVMFKSEGNDGRGVRAKVVDFGLSIKLDSSATHLSNAFQGTMTHMAPEVMMEGKQSRAADVYAFGVTLWELFTGGSPYKGLPPAALSQVVVFQQKRPAWPGSTPLEFKSLAEECWQPNLSARPPFESILDKLTRMRSVVQEKSKPLESILARSPFQPGDASFLPPQLEKAAFAIGGSSMTDWVPTILQGPSSHAPVKNQAENPLFVEYNDSLRYEAKTSDVLEESETPIRLEQATHPLGPALITGVGDSPAAGETKTFWGADMIQLGNLQAAAANKSRAPERRALDTSSPLRRVPKSQASFPSIPRMASDSQVQTTPNGVTKLFSNGESHMDTAKASKIKRMSICSELDKIQSEASIVLMAQGLVSGPSSPSNPTSPPSHNALDAPANALSAPANSSHRLAQPPTRRQTLPSFPTRRLEASTASPASPASPDSPDSPVNSTRYLLAAVEGPASGHVSVTSPAGLAALAAASVRRVLLPEHVAAFSLTTANSSQTAGQLQSPQGSPIPNYTVRSKSSGLEAHRKTDGVLKRIVSLFNKTRSRSTAATDLQKF